jgi:signal transduction histidine kinase
VNVLRKKWSSTIRVRLTALYGGAFFLAGFVLIGVMYLQLTQVIGQQLVLKSFIVGPPPTEQRAPTEFRLQLPPGAERAMAPPGVGVLAELQAQMRDARAAALKRVMVISVASLVGVGILAVALGWLMAGRALQPLRQITTTVRSIADRNLHQRIAMEGPQDEIKDLSDTLDDMLARLDRVFDSQQRFIANASHELRTPLAINRTLIEVAMLKEPRPESPLVQLGSTLLAVNQRHERLIEGLLMLASGEQEIADPQDVELAEIARHVLLEAAVMARRAAVEVRSRIEPATCRGDAVLLERLIQNLVDNAIRYNLPAEGWISVATSLDAQGGACIDVENSGSVIPSYEVPRLFEPFRRLASTERLADGSHGMGRRGAGLGLSIVRAIVTSHGGSVSATPRPEGGLAVHVNLPASKG